MSENRYIRPKRVFPDPFEAAINVEYVVESFDSSTGKVNLILTIQRVPISFMMKHKVLQIVPLQFLFFFKPQKGDI